jgi:hypothetical protein
MASPNSTFTELVTTTLRQHRKEITDNISNGNVLSSRLNSKSRIEIIDGGYEIVEPLDYAENASFQRYSGFDPLNVSASEVLSAAKFDWKQSAIHVTASGLELRSNAGKNQLIKLAKARLTNAMRTAKNKMSEDIYSDGTASNQINGLQALISDAGTGTVGGIISGTETWWKNAVQSAATPLQGGSAIVVSAGSIQSLMLPLWLEVSRGGDTPDIIPCSNNYFTYYEESLTDLKRYTTDGKGQGGFTSLKYKSADVVADGGTRFGSGIPDSHMYFVNTDFIKLVVHKDANWTEVPEQRAVNQDAVVIPIIWQGNLTTSLRAALGVLKA